MDRKWAVAPAVVDLFFAKSPRPSKVMTGTTARNYWTDARCAKAFWGQQELPAYRRLLADTLDWADPAAGERWLDLGCGGGPIATAILAKTVGSAGPDRG